jgi:hypothetical protein
MEHIHTNFSLLYDKIKYIKKHKIRIPADYSMETIDKELLQLIKKNKIGYELYRFLCLLDVEGYATNYFLTTTNGFNIADGLYEQGSKQIYKSVDENGKMIGLKFSEHYGYMLYENGLLDKVTIINKSRIDPRDPTIFFPKNVRSIGKFNYIFHTHPVTPFIGSRAMEGIIYDSPSINDVLHFIEYHNYGKLLCSLVISAEGLYVIRKYNFNTDMIKMDDGVFTDDFDDVMAECSDYAYNKYSHYVEDERIAEETFHKVIAMDFSYINLINKVLMKYDLYIDYYPRMEMKGSDGIEKDDGWRANEVAPNGGVALLTHLQWVIPDIYMPNVVY